MILLAGILIGLPAGVGRAWLTGEKIRIPELRLTWLVPIAFLPQLIAFQIPATRQNISIDLAAVALVSSQSLLLVFAWINRKNSGGGMLLLGLSLNLLVILLNGGLMPISPETIHRLAPDIPQSTWHVGERLGTGKDIILPVPLTRFPWLSDRFLLPTWFPSRVAFSIGDAFIALGAFWALWETGGTSNFLYKLSLNGAASPDERSLSL